MQAERDLISADRIRHEAWRNSLGKHSSGLGLGTGSLKVSHPWQKSSAPAKRFAFWRHAKIHVDKALLHGRKALSDVESALTKLCDIHRVAIGRMKYAALGLMLTGTAAAAGLVVVGYVDRANSDWPMMLRGKRLSPIYSAGSGRLLGSLPPTGGNISDDDIRNWGFVDAGAPTDLYVQAVTALEQKHFMSPWRNICGMDILSAGKRILSGTGGGSGLTSQLDKALNEMSGESRSSNLMVLTVQKLKEIGAGCRVFQELGREKVLRLYANFSPVIQGSGGTLRGAEAGSNVLFGHGLSQASDGETFILAAAVQRPVSIVPATAFAAGCPALLASEGLTGDEKKARNQCALLGRARAVARQVLTGPRLTTAISEITAFETTGIQPANPWAPVSTKRLLNLSLRTRALIPAGVLQRLVDEAEQMQVAGGEALYLSLSDQQPQFVAATHQAFSDLENSREGRETLCIPMTPSHVTRHCPGTVAPTTPSTATIVLSKLNLRTGQIRLLYESDKAAFDFVSRMGSISKLIVVVAAINEGYTAESKLCPRAVRAGGRNLLRVTVPRQGYAECRPDQMLSLEQAIGESDSLAIYDLARSLGNKKLMRAMTALGLTPDANSKNLAYDLAFGTATATPGELLRLGQRVFSSAYSIPVLEDAPRLLSKQGAAQQKGRIALQSLVDTPKKRADLRQIIEAPLASGMTMGWLRPEAQAGKSGTSSAIVRPSPRDRPYVSGKFFLAFQKKSNSVVLSSIQAATPTQALGPSDLEGGFFDKPVMNLFKFN